MYDLPEDLDFQEWIGKRLDVVSFGKYSIHFIFEGPFSTGPLKMTVESLFSYQKASDASTPEPIRVTAAQSDLMQLLGHTIKNVSDEGDRTLAIEFDNGDVLRFYDPHEPYEAYQIEFAGKLIVV
jgi:hypothetical protein